ncbi:MAG: hypothetical protein IRY83_15120 [Chloroflexi bacterium]|nr:hypothetical protein [Chloroflexota bacterium]
MNALPLAYAFAAGMAATVNPCGFVMLPTLVSYYLGTADLRERDQPVWRRGAAGLGLGLAATAGFVALFTVVGAALAAGGQALSSIFPWLGFAIGVILALLGLWLLLSGRSLGIVLLHRVQPPRWRSPAGFFLFGVAYEAASLSCHPSPAPCRSFWSSSVGPWRPLGWARRSWSLSATPWGWGPS